MSENKSQTWATKLLDGSRIPTGLRISLTSRGRRIYVRGMVQGKTFQTVTPYFEEQAGGIEQAIKFRAALASKGTLSYETGQTRLPSFAAPLTDSVASIFAAYFRYWHGVDDPTPADPTDPRNRGKKSKKDISQFQSQAGYFIDYFGEHRSVQSIDYDALRGYVMHRSRQKYQGRKAPTIKSIMYEIRVFKAAVREGKTNGVVANNWSPRWPVPRDFPEAKLQGVDPTKKAHYRSPTEMADFISRLPDWVADIFRFGMYTGYRAGAIERITVAGFDPVNRTVTVLHKASAKGPETHAITPKAASILTKVIAERGLGGKPNALIFVRNMNGDLYTNKSENGYINEVQKLNDKLGRHGAHRIKLRDTRKSSGTNFYTRNGNDIIKTRDFLMHKSVQMTELYLGLGRHARDADSLDEDEY